MSLNYYSLNYSLKQVPFLAAAKKRNRKLLEHRGSFNDTKTQYFYFLMHTQEHSEDQDRLPN